MSKAMVANEKILKSLKAAKIHLENSISALDKKDENSFADNLWHVGAELEYVLFLFSVAFQNETNLSKGKANPELKKIKTGSMLMEMSNLLNDIEKFIEDKKVFEAYKKAYIARHYALKVQEDIAREKREARRKK